MLKDSWGYETKAYEGHGNIWIFYQWKPLQWMFLEVSGLFHMDFMDNEQTTHSNPSRRWIKLATNSKSAEQWLRALKTKTHSFKLISENCHLSYLRQNESLCESYQSWKPTLYDITPLLLICTASCIINWKTSFLWVVKWQLSPAGFFCLLVFSPFAQSCWCHTYINGAPPL